MPLFVSVFAHAFAHDFFCLLHFASYRKSGRSLSIIDSSVSQAQVHYSPCRSLVLNALCDVPVYVLSSYGIKAPYKVLSELVLPTFAFHSVSADSFHSVAPVLFLRPVDGQFVQSCLENKILIREQMPKLFQTEADKCTTFVTKCVRADLQKLGKAYSGAHRYVGLAVHLELGR